MTASTLIIIKSLCILPLLFMSASGFLFDRNPFLQGLLGHHRNHDHRHRHRHRHNHKRHNNENQIQFGKPGFWFGMIPGFGHTGGEDEEGRIKHEMPIQKGQQQQQQQKAGIVETNYLGKWELVSKNSGVSSMHLQLMPNNKLVMFDATSLGKSAIQLPPGLCRLIPKTTKLDCFAHSVEYDPQTNQVRTLKVVTDPWCSSGGLSPDGTLVGTGGWADGEKTLRYINACDTCDWRESNIKLADNRWYASQAMLADGRFFVIGGRRAFTYEIVAPEGQLSAGKIDFPFLRETTDLHENNLYPFVHLAPDGNLFILANNRAILLDVRTNKIVRNYPDLPGGARNYPGSGSSAILPINLRENNGSRVDIEVLVCGGGQPLAFGKAEKEGIFLPALDTCGRIKVLDPFAQWEMDKMPSPRVMGDMLNLPNGQILMLNGAKKGSSGWQFADDPNFTPVIYSPDKPLGQRFKNLAPTQIPRMYHSTSAVLPDGRILVAGSNTNPAYLFKVKFPTELRVEKFDPPYLDPEFEKLKPKVNLLSRVVNYGKTIQLTCNLFDPDKIQQGDITVTIYRPPFTTHGYSMNQRLLNLAISSFAPQAFGNYNVQAEAPATPELAPPGYYLLFVNYRGVPSTGSWIQLRVALMTFIASAIALQMSFVDASFSNSCYFYWGANRGQFTGPDSVELRLDKFGGKYMQQILHFVITTIRYFTEPLNDILREKNFL